MKVLVVEDNESSRLLLEEILRSRGHEVTTAADGEAALGACAEEEFPLVVLDWLLPGMNGLALCRRIRALPHGDRSLILMVTARDRAEDLKAVLEAGADDYVPKPIDIGALDVRFGVAERQVENLLERKRAEAGLAAARAEIEKSLDDLISILNQLQVGTAMTDADGRLTFVSRTGEAFLGRRGRDLIGRRWQDALPFPEADRRAIEEVMRLAEAERAKVSAVVEGLDGERRWTDVEVHDDPRDPRGKIFGLYDVSDVHNLRLLLDGKAHFQDLVGKSKVMLDVYEQIRQVASVDATVLVEGETGTGKELVARAIHFESHRKGKPFVAVNCAGLTDSVLASQLFGHKRGSFTGAVEDHKGYFEAASSGTVFLDEIGDVSANVQTSLLRVLQEKEITRLGETKPRKVDVRVIAATHHDLARDVAAGTFRSDLLYRIRVARIRLPALRERREDIPVLASAFVGQARALTGKAIEGLAEAAVAKLIAYPWPGNVRELKSALEYAAIRTSGTAIGVEDLPPEVVAGGEVASGNVPGLVLERGSSGAPGLDDEQRIRLALEQAKGNRSAAARILGVSRATFYRRLAELGLNADDL